MVNVLFVTDYIIYRHRSDSNFYSTSIGKEELLADRPRTALAQQEGRTRRLRRTKVQQFGRRHHQLLPQLQDARIEGFLLTIFLLLEGRKGNRTHLVVV
jgi:hypothetical protein